MKTLFPFVIFILHLSLFSGCSFNTKEESKQKIQSLDRVNEFPEWLKLNVDEAFPINDLNIWVPTNNFQTSSLVRVPRFPRKYNEIEKNNNEALKDFEIIVLSPDKTLDLTVVKNEQASAQIAFGAKQDLTNVKVSIDNLSTLNGSVLSKENIQIRYVKYMDVQRARSEYVWSPKMEEIIGEGVSGNSAPNVIGDPLMELNSIDVPAYTSQSAWFTFRIPRNINSGTYEGKITIYSNEYGEVKQKIKLEILDIQLPDPIEYNFNLDLWINPSSIAGYYQLENWSEAHWDMIEKYLKDYASRGGKNITTTITNEPWHKPWLNNTTISQSYYGYKSMVKWIKNETGELEFDYSIFDRYVEMSTNLGIAGSINAYSLTPFLTSQKIQYYDMTDEKYKLMELNVKDEKYKEVWTKFLISFKKHLIEKRLFDRTYLGFDEKPESVILILKEIIKNATPEFLDRIVIAGHPETTSLAKNLSIAYVFFPNQSHEKRAEVPVLQTILERNDNDNFTTFYLCAEPAHPNTLTYSPAIESQLTPWLALKYKTDGYLRWAYNNWTNDPFNKPVFIHNQGDDYYVYPGEKGPISSIRWELLKEGIEDYELFKLVKKKANVSPEKLQEAIELSTRNQDGRYKNADDMLKARNILLEK